MSEGTRTAPARPFWDRIEAERNSRDWTKLRLYEEVKARLGGEGFSRVTLDRLKTQARPPYVATVNAIAEVLGIPQGEAHRLAGLVSMLDVSEADTQPQGMAVADIEDPEIERLLAELPSDQRRMLQQVLEEERARLAKVRRRAREGVAAEARESSERFAKLVRLAQELPVTPDT